jgi:DNA mismatch repair protein MutL
MAIQVLPDLVVAQISAGEVVERPASVVKELIENSLDAGACNIHVSISGGGRRMIRVSDDGSGIASNEVELGFARHATSKLRSVDDLLTIQTLGFRGEALASIGSVSHVTLTTRFHDESAGTMLRLEGGQVHQRKAIGAPIGTVITVENLFYNTPARLKFLKKENTEKRHISTIVTRYAIAYPRVRFMM